MEGLSRVASGVLQKTLGVHSADMQGSCIATIVIGIVQMIIGKGGMSQTKLPKADWRHIRWPIAFGVLAGCATIAAMQALMQGADLGIFALIVAASIVPSTVVGRLIFHEPLGKRQGAGILLFVVTIWVSLGCPMITDADGAPLWIWLTVCAVACVVANEALSKKASGILDVWTSTFWIGASTVVTCLVALILIALAQEEIRLPTPAFWAVSVGLGLVTANMIGCRWLAFQTGATIPLRRIIIEGIYLLCFTGIGVASYGDPITWGKVVAIGLFPIAFFLTDEKAWWAIRSWRPYRNEGTL
jgi:drug/metabolite transporter (DMT)-like permease